jgi:GMP synthase (glutamine-hydrolysing)
MIRIIDCGSQLTLNIARRIREQNVYCEVIPYNSDKEISSDVEGIIISGGPNSVQGKGSPSFDKKILSLGIPILGICYGMQSLAHQLGGRVEKGDKQEYGKTPLKIEKDSLLFKNIPSNINVWMSHWDVVKEMPNGFRAIAKSESHIAGMENQQQKIYAVQFHPEADHTEHGREILKNFIDICNCKKNWSMPNFIEEQVSKIKEEVKDDVVIGGVSGGVDSTTAAVLLSKAIGKNFVPIFINNGLLRLDEEKQVIQSFKEANIDINYIDASEEFLTQLQGVSDPETKRKIIGKVFIDVFEREAKKIKGANYLMQGTLYPDVVESIPIFGSSDVIKSHHNVGGLPEKLNLKLIEPFRFLFKDEVRKVAKTLGIPKELFGRHPFPGPGLAIRVVGEISKEKLEILRKADSIFIQELRNNNIYDEIWQALAAILPVRSVGVMGDAKTYDYMITLRAVTSKDGMTADWYRFDQEVLAKISNRIINEVNGVNRVVYDISSKPPGTIEYE